VQNFTPVGPRISEISGGRKKTSRVKLKSAPQAIAFGRTKKCKIKKYGNAFYKFITWHKSSSHIYMDLNALESMGNTNISQNCSIEAE